MKKITVEEKITNLYQCSILEFFQQCMQRKMETHDIAKLLDCSVSNLRRIARKYNFHFHHPEPTPMLSQNQNFLKKNLTIDNFLSRRWRIEQYA
ncbi:hypothetical protein [Cysteiniphilum halobium]|uniref:hypothetical protein n=1 Tax=Cysteiniphilum halobium TaxID=2219059 RepID=UPI000E65794A|nr:hypothetical protein [Cysteiniphilum halobium]